MTQIGPFRPSRETLLLIAILVLAFGLRVWGLNFGLPNLSRPDENHISDAAFTILISFFSGKPSLNPSFFYYPSLFIYLVTLAYAVYYQAGYIFGLFPTTESFYLLYQDDWGSFLLLSRAFSALFGTLTVWAIFHLARAVTQCGRTALLTAFLLAVTYLHVRDSHFGVTDVTATFFITACLWRTVAYARSWRHKHLYAAAILAGLAASVKYPAGLVALPVLLAFWQNLRMRGQSLADLWTRPELMRETLLVIGAMAGAFLLTSPYVLLDYAGFLRDVDWQRDFMQDAILDLGLGWTRVLTFGLWHGLGPLYFLAALGTIVWLWKTRPQDRAIHTLLLGFLAAYYLLTGNTKMVFVRYAIPMIPVLALYAAWGVSEAGQRLAKHPANVPIITLILLTVVSFTSLRQSLQLDFLLGQPDTRTLARQWFARHLKAGEAVGVGDALGGMQLSNTYKKYMYSKNILNRIPSLPHRADGRPAYTENAVNLRNEYLIQSYADIPTLQRLGIRYVTVTQSPVPLYGTPDEERQALERHPAVRLVKHFSPYSAFPPAPESFDQLDAFYLPYYGLDSFRRPGPDMRIYEVLPAPTSKM